jgi:type III restriction enzyme
MAAKKGKGAGGRPRQAGIRHSVVQYDQSLPEIPERQAHEAPTSHLMPDGKGGYKVVPGRRQSKLLLIEKLRAEVTAWRGSGPEDPQRYKSASETSRRLLDYWFGADHRLRDGEFFRFYFGQREAIETLIYVHEVKKLRDTADLVIDYMDGSAYGDDLFLKRKQIVEDIRGKRRLQRLVPETGQLADQTLPPEALPRYALKMATGSGKTVVMALAIAWSYFHRRFEKGSDMARRFLLLAPNVIVFERLRTDFENEKIFRDLPIVPPEWKHDWQFRTVLCGDADTGSGWGTLYLTNIQQLYDRTDDGPINPVDFVLGPRVKKDSATRAESIVEMVQRHDDLMVLNDEAHHVHNEDIEWWQIIERLHSDLRKRTGHGLCAQLDFTATPKDSNGTFFPWIICDYPLAQAVEDRIVKAPLVVHQTDREDPEKYTNAAVAYREWIGIALMRWREHRDAFKPIGMKSVLFVMAEDTKDAEDIARSIRLEADIDEDEVLVIHTDKKGEITKGDLDKAREAARTIDDPKSKIKVVVSVLMLREGWDVRSVTVILGLRPFTSKANILPEQAVGRGLRLMRHMHPDYAQVVEIIGTPKFEDFVRQLEVEGVGVGSTKTPPPPGVHIAPLKPRSQYDLEIPRVSQTYARNYKNLATFDIKTLPSGVVSLTGKKAAATQVDIVHGLTEVQLARRTVDFQPDQVFAEDVLAHVTSEVIRSARLGCPFVEAYPLVRKYVSERFFGETVDLASPVVARTLARAEVASPLVRTLAEAMGKHTSEEQKMEIKPDPIRLSDTRAFIWRRRIADAKKTIFNHVACFNQFEADFAKFLDRADDVVAFAKLAEWFTGFALEYLSSTGAVRLYYPDFLAKVEDAKGTTMWLVETKGWERDEEVSRKDAHAEWWCAQVSKQTGTSWKYAKVPYRTFHSAQPKTFAGLVAALAPAAGRQLVFAGTAG